MPAQWYGSVRITSPEYSREELIALLREQVAELAAALPLRRVTLFGSWATGRATAYSDVDVAIVYAGPRRPDAFDTIRRLIPLRGLEPHAWSEVEAAQLAATIERMTRGGVELYP